MNHLSRRSILSMASMVSIAVAATTLTFPAAAQTFPGKPVRLIVPFASGGASDTFARVISQPLSDRLGQPVLVENRPGAGGTIAAGLVAKSPADGYTLLVADIGTHGIASSLYPALGYDAIKDFVPISYSIGLPLVLVVTPSVAAKSVRELSAESKARSGKLDYASSGSGGISHLAVEMLKTQAGIDMVHIPYKGGAPALTDVMGGQVQMMMPSVSTALQHIRSGRVRALGVASAKRLAALPDVPTIRESGLNDYVVEPWVGIMAPTGIPDAVSTQLQREFAAVLAQPAIREKLTALGFEVLGASAEDLARVIKNDIPRWALTVRQSGAKVE